MILVTGGSGFLGHALSERLIEDAILRISVRDRSKAVWPPGVDVVEAELTQDQDWTNALSGITAVVHCAARVHILKDVNKDSLSEFRKENVDATLRLAKQASEAGVRRFIFISSIKVNGGSTQPGFPFDADDPPAPEDPYAVSKYEAELGLKAISESTSMEIVIIRPPLIYGPGVKANFLFMVNWMRRGLPLPLAGVVKNRRSLIFLDNLIDLIMVCLIHPAASNQIFIASDDEDLSTAELIYRMYAGLGQQGRMFFVPPSFIKFLGTLIGGGDIVRRLCGSLQVDIKKTKRMLGWSPRISATEGLRRTMQYHVSYETDE